MTYEDLSPIEIQETIIYEMATEIARKLMEFNKVIVEYQPNLILYKGMIEIIVPPTPKENLDAQP